MLCETQRDIDGAITGVSPSAFPFARCLQGCCKRTVQLQIRGRYRYGAARLCASFVDPEGDPTVFYLNSTGTIIYHRYNGETEIGTCTYTLNLNSGASAIVTGSDSLPDCDGTPPDEEETPGDCVAHLWDDPVNNVEAESGGTSVGGGSATTEEVRTAAIGAMAYGDWSDWSTILTMDIDSGFIAGTLGDVYLAEAGLGDNGLGGGYFQANASQHESELRVLGNFPMSIAVSEGSDLTTATVARYVLTPGTSRAFSVGAPSSAEGWVSDLRVLRCVCPVEFAATS